MTRQHPSETSRTAWFRGLQRQRPPGLTTNEVVGSKPLTMSVSAHSRNAGVGTDPMTPNPATEYAAHYHQWVSAIEVETLNIDLDVWRFVLGGIANDQRPERPNLKMRIRELQRTAGSDNWDGEGSLAISAAAVKVALQLADKLPAGIDDPDVAATPHGEVDFDWMAGRSAMLTISIDSDGTLAWAALFDECRSRGTARWTGELACPVDCCLQHIASM